MLLPLLLLPPPLLLSSPSPSSSSSSCCVVVSVIDGNCDGDGMRTMITIPALTTGTLTGSPASFACILGCGLLLRQQLASVIPCVSLVRAVGRGSREMTSSSLSNAPSSRFLTSSSKTAPGDSHAATSCNSPARRSFKSAS